MTAQHGKISNYKENYSNHNKGAIINIAKVAAKRSILMQITRAIAASLFH
jgi:hypothetical protein